MGANFVIGRHRTPVDIHRGTGRTTDHRLGMAQHKIADDRDRFETHRRDHHATKRRLVLVELTTHQHHARLGIGTETIAPDRIVERSTPAQARLKLHHIVAVRGHYPRALTPVHQPDIGVGVLTKRRKRVGGGPLRRRASATALGRHRPLHSGGELRHRLEIETVDRYLQRTRLTASGPGNTVKILRHVRARGNPGTEVAEVPLRAAFRRIRVSQHPFP